MLKSIFGKILVIKYGYVLLGLDINVFLKRFFVIIFGNIKNNVLNILKIFIKKVFFCVFVKFFFESVF